MFDESRQHVEAALHLNDTGQVGQPQASGDDPLHAREGSGQSERQLPDEFRGTYCDRLAERLTYVRKALRAEQAEGRLSLAAFVAASTLLQELSTTLTLVALEHGVQVLKNVPRSLVIDPIDSGMPTVTYLQQLHRDTQPARDQLAQLPSEAEIVEAALDSIYRDQRPVKQQTLWLQRAYIAKLSSIPAFHDVRIGDPVALNDWDNDHPFSISWSSVHTSTHLFQSTTLHALEHISEQVTDRMAQLHSLIRQFEHGQQTLDEMLITCHESGWLIPHTIERVIIGPYHHQWTDHRRVVETALVHSDDRDPWILRCSLQRAATVRAAQQTSFDTMMSRDATALPTRSLLIVIPMAIRQHVMNLNEYGAPTTVYGVSVDGDVTR